MENNHKKQAMPGIQLMQGKENPTANIKIMNKDYVISIEMKIHVENSKERSVKKKRIGDPYKDYKGCSF